MDAELRYPLPDPLSPGYSQTAWEEQWRKQSDVQDKLMAEYKREVAARHGITVEQLRDIESEGLVESWPWAGE